MDTQQQEVKSLVHDLNNKIAIVKSFYFAWNKGMKMDFYEVTPVFDRIDEIMLDIGAGLDLKAVKPRLRFHTYDEMILILGNIMVKIQRIFPDIQVSFTSEKAQDAKLRQILFDDSIFYQNLENAVENSYKAGARRVSTSLKVCQSHLDIIVQDDGMGFKRASGHEFSPLGYGTRIIHQNCIRLGGECVYTSIEGSGTTLKIRLYPVIN